MNRQHQSNIQHNRVGWIQNFRWISISIKTKRRKLCEIWFLNYSNLMYWISKKKLSNKKKCRIRGFQYISFPMISILESYIPLNTLWLLYLSPDIIALSNSFTNFSHKIYTSCLDFKKNLLFCNPPQKSWNQKWNSTYV